MTSASWGRPGDRDRDLSERRGKGVFLTTAITTVHVDLCN
jgi:hypothetical protein